MSATFDKLKALLETNKKLTNEEVSAAVAATGEMTDDEKFWLESERHKLARDQEETVTLEQYLEATKTLDTAPEGSDEYKKAEALVQKYESGL